MTKILVTGASGQLGSCIRDAAAGHANYEWSFASKKELDITNSKQVIEWVAQGSYDYIINTSGFTNVELAEKEPDRAFQLNAEALKPLTTSCLASETTLIHISTDYVFDGNKNTPYVESDSTKPLNIYGASKLKGEEIIQASGCKYFIIRTSWLYSQYGHNFLKSVLRMAKEEKKLTVTTEQKGTPTNANDLAAAIIKITQSNEKRYGVYHFSNQGEATWYEFAESILLYAQQLKDSILEKTTHYPTFAERPKFSVLDTSLFEDTFNAPIPNWKNSLKSLLLANQNNLVLKKNT